MTPATATVSGHGGRFPATVPGTGPAGTGGPTRCGSLPVGRIPADPRLPARPGGGHRLSAESPRDQPRNPAVRPGTPRPEDHSRAAGFGHGPADVRPTGAGSDKGLEPADTGRATAAPGVSGRSETGRCGPGRAAVPARSGALVAGARSAQLREVRRLATSAGHRARAWPRTARAVPRAHQVAPDSVAPPLPMARRPGPGPADWRHPSSPSTSRKAA